MAAATRIAGIHTPAGAKPTIAPGRHGLWVIEVVEAIEPAGMARVGRRRPEEVLAYP